jgi:hypothetical protein
MDLPVEDAQTLAVPPLLLTLGAYEATMWLVDPFGVHTALSNGQVRELFEGSMLYA